eukprot:gene20033-61054_t
MLYPTEGEHLWLYCCYLAPGPLTAGLPLYPVNRWKMARTHAARARRARARKKRRAQLATDSELRAAVTARLRDACDASDDAGARCDDDARAATELCEAVCEGCGMLPNEYGHEATRLKAAAAAALRGDGMSLAAKHGACARACAACG